MKRVLPVEAKALVDAGWTYLDVRTEAEFASGHPLGALNVPYPNPKFVQVVKALFPVDHRLVVGCMAGGRSARAVAELEAHGYQQLVDQTAGWGGRPDAKGWAAEKLPTGQGVTYAALLQKAGL